MRALHQFDAFADGSVWGNAIEIAELIDAHAKGDADFDVGRTRNTAGDQIIELRLIAEASEDNLGREACVARVELGGALEEQVGCIAALVDLAKHVESDLARGGDQVLF